MKACSSGTSIKLTITQRCLYFHNHVLYPACIGRGPPRSIGDNSRLMCAPFTSTGLRNLTSDILVLILASVLIVILFTTGILTSFVVFSYLFFRLATLVHQEGRSGIYNWAGETKHHFVFWGPNGNRVSASTTGKDSVEPSFQSQADRQEHKNHSVGNSSDILDDSR